MSAGLSLECLALQATVERSILGSPNTWRWCPGLRLRTMSSGGESFHKPILTFRSICFPFRSRTAAFTNLPSSTTCCPSSPTSMRNSTSLICPLEVTTVMVPSSGMILHLMFSKLLKAISAFGGLYPLGGRREARMFSPSIRVTGVGEQGELLLLDPVLHLAPGSINVFVQACSGHSLH